MSRYTGNWLKTSNKQIILLGLQLSILLFVAGLHAVTNVILGLAFLFWLIQALRNKTIFQSFKSKWYWLISGIFYLSIAGLLYSQDLGQGLKYVEMRLLIALLPLMLLTVTFNKFQYRKILLTWVLAVTAGFLIGLIYSYMRFMETGDSGFFYNDNLLVLIRKQAPYYSLFVNFALLATLFLMGEASRRYKFFLGFIFCLLLVCQFLLAVRIALLTLVVLFVLGMIYQAVYLRGKSGLIGMIAGIVILIGSVFLFPQTLNRFRSMFSNFEYQFDNPNPVNHFNAAVSDENWNGLTLRLALWHCGWDAYKLSPIVGVGTGDYDTVMEDQYEIKNFIYAREMNFGVHSQYLYTMISFGIPGIAWVAGLLFMFLKRGILRADWLLLGLTVILALAFVTENILNRYYGIFFYAMMVPLILRHSDD